MAQVTIPQRKSKDFGTLGTIVGGVAGAYFGESPQAALAGAQAGQFVGGTMDNMQQQKQVPTVTAPSAMQRRQNVLETDNLSALRNAEIASAQLPEKQRQDVMGVLAQARLRQEQMDKAQRANKGYEGYA